MAEQGVRRHGGALRSVREGRIVRIRDDEPPVSDGPFAETKEQIGGYDVDRVHGLGEAIQVAAAHPLARAATVEVRPFWDTPGGISRRFVLSPVFSFVVMVTSQARRERKRA